MLDAAVNKGSDWGVTPPDMYVQNMHGTVYAVWNFGMAGVWCIV